VTVKSTRTSVATITRSKTSFLAWATPDYFNTLACCKTIVTVTEYVPGYVAPTTSAAPAYTPKGDYDYDHDYVPKASSSTPAAPELPSKPAYTPKADYTPAPEYTPKPSYSVPAEPAVPSKPAYSGEGPFHYNGDKWGITYTPYTKTGQCKTADEVDADLAKIKSYGFTTIRLYATDCSGLENVATGSKKHGLDIILGVFIDKTGVQASWDQVDAIGAWGQSKGWDNVVLVVVGNEAVFNGYVSGPELATYITQVKSFLAGKGYGGWVTTTEPVNIIQANKDCLAPVVDVAGANIQPYFTSSVSASGAGDFVLGQLALVEAALGKTAYNLECGWPSQGKANGAAVPSKEDQKTAILDIIAKAGKKTVVFSYEDDSWKGDDEFSVEKYWGCGDIFGY
jgi:exo-beta-1,3-glucanase (GH17 family)